jgi:hypothetical protein
MMTINAKAPVKAAAEIEVHAGAETVWDVLTDIRRWPEWNPDVKSVSLEGDLAEGTVFRWRSGPGNIVSTIESIKKGTQIAWSGRTMGIRAAHVWRLEELGADRTLVTTEESWEGAVASLLRWPARRMLQNSFEKGLARLKAEAERRKKAGVVTAS